MPIDPNVFSKLKTYNDYAQAEEEFQMRKQLQQAQAKMYEGKASGIGGGGATLAATQKLMEADPTLDFATAYSFAKTGLGQGMTYGQGGVQPMANYISAQAGLAGAKSGAEQQAKSDVDLRMGGPIKAAEKAGEAAGAAQGAIDKKIIQAPELERQLKLAEQLLPKATSGGFNTWKRDAAGFFNQTTDGAGADSQLDVIGAALTSAVPRMEGPQSNLDVELYKKAAGDLANSKLPAKRRIDAIKTMRDLNNKYMPAQGDQNAATIFTDTPSAPVNLQPMQQPQINPADAINELRRRGKI